MKALPIGDCQLPILLFRYELLGAQSQRWTAVKSAIGNRQLAIRLGVA